MGLSLGDCFEFDTDLVGNDLTEHTSVPSVDDCQRVCQVEAGCTHFTYQESQLKCKTKTSDSGRTNLVAGFDSGPKYCGKTFDSLMFALHTCGGSNCILL